MKQNRNAAGAPRRATQYAAPRYSGNILHDQGDSLSAQKTSSRPWLIALPTVGLLVLGLIWSGFWYYSSLQAEAAMEAWRTREAGSGRVYGCTKAEFGGYPFRIEVTCSDPSVDDRTSALSIRARNLSAVAQVWDPTLVIGEIVGPMTIGPLGGSPITTIDWTLAQASLRGTPGTPERLAVVVDKPSLQSVPPSDPLVGADHAEFHARFAADSTAGHPVLDLALDLSHFSAPAGRALTPPLGPLAVAATDASIVAVLRDAPDLAPKPLSQRLREIQAANGRLEIKGARLQQGDLIASAEGALALTPRGTLSGELKLTIVNFAKLVPMLGIERITAQAAPDTLNRFAPALNRIMPGLGGILGGNAGGGSGGTGASPAGGTVTANANAAMLGALALGGRQTQFEGQQAVSLTLRFDDGAVQLGPLKLGQIGPLF
jgi:hypothetical protein